MLTETVDLKRVSDENNKPIFTTSEYATFTSEDDSLQILVYGNGEIYMMSQYICLNHETTASKNPWLKHRQQPKIDPWTVETVRVAVHRATVFKTQKNDGILESHIFDEICPICLDVLGDHIVVTICSHYFHNECMRKSLSTNMTCPMCRSQLRDA